jgi:hypothetical protein
LLSVSAAAPRATCNRVEYRRGTLTEWYVNGPTGVEQGFALAQPPGQANGQPLTIALALSGDFVAALEPGETGLQLMRRNAPALRYTGLSAYDATGRELRTWLELQDDHGLLLHVEDTDARYPIVIDPFVQQAKLTASDGAAGDKFGRAVAIDGNTVVVGAPFAPAGAVYVFVKPATGWATTSTFNAKLTASDGAAGDLFGFDVAINGDTVVVGSATFAPGAAYVFFKPATGWASTSTFDAKLTASDGTPGNAFGASAVSGDTVVVGAEFANIGSSILQGASYVYSFFVPFSAFSARIVAEDISAPLFAALGSFTLGTASHGINPVTEPVTLQIGTFSVTIPAGSFKLNRNGTFEFQGTINGVTLDVRIVPLGHNRFDILAAGIGVDLTTLPNPVIVTLTIGNDGGTTTATLNSF